MKLVLSPLFAACLLSLAACTPSPTDDTQASATPTAAVASAPTATPLAAPAGSAPGASAPVDATAVGLLDDYAQKAGVLSTAIADQATPDAIRA